MERLPSWHVNPMNRLVKRPKLHVCDTGVACALLDADSARLDADRRALGAMLETFVLRELRRQAGWRPDPIELFHFRDPRRLRGRYRAGRRRRHRWREVESGDESVRRTFAGSASCRVRRARDLAPASFFMTAARRSAPTLARLFAVPVRRLWRPRERRLDRIRRGRRCTRLARGAPLRSSTAHRLRMAGGSR
ncbi:MAG: DUF4143 domain-containing protein [bacterium]